MWNADTILVLQIVVKYGVSISRFKCMKRDHILTLLQLGNDCTVRVQLFFTTDYLSGILRLGKNNLDYFIRTIFLFFDHVSYNQFCVHKFAMNLL